MKKLSIAFSFAVITTIFLGCHPSLHNNGGQAKLAVSDTFSRFIPMDTANKMLSSYLTSINYTTNDTDLQSLIFDVCQLRRYIDSMPGSDQITHIKLMFAHTLSYANSTRVNTPAGYNSNGLTIIIAAYDANGNYIFYNGNTVLDYAEPCPPVCPPGNAGQPLLTSTSK